MTRQLLFISLTTTLVLATVSMALAGHAQIGTATHGSIHPETCRYSRYDGHRGWSPKEVTLTIRCAVRRWPVPGGATQAIAVARCESGLNERAVSSSGSYAGVFQQAVSYWPGRYRTYRPQRFDLRQPVLNGRSNVVVSVKMAHAGGWGPWSCA